MSNFYFKEELFFSLKPLKLKVIAEVKKYESENKINSELSHLLKSTSLDNNESNNKLPDLIDLAPLTYSKTDLLASLDENWFQRTGVVSEFKKFKSLIYNQIMIDFKGCWNYREKK